MIVSSFGPQIAEGALRKTIGSCGLVDSLPDTVRVFENSFVVKLKKLNKWNVEFANGTITADCVVLATNPFIKQFGFKKNRTVSTFTYAAVTSKVQDKYINYTGSLPVWGILLSHRMGTTCRKVGIDRLMVRSLASYEKELNTDKVHDRLRKIFEARWPKLKHIDFEYVWGGAIGFTMNGSPWWGKLDDGLYGAGGCNGGGINKGTLLGKRLAELIVGHGSHDEFLAAIGAPSWMVPEPFRQIGFNFLRRKGEAEASLEI